MNKKRTSILSLVFLLLGRPRKYLLSRDLLRVQIINNGEMRAKMYSAIFLPSARSRFCYEGNLVPNIPTLQQYLPHYAKENVCRY